MAGHVNENERDDIRSLFNSNGWILYDESWLKGKLTKLANEKYENNIAVMVAKLLNRG